MMIDSAWSQPHHDGVVGTELVGLAGTMVQDFRGWSRATPHASRQSDPRIPKE
jgi:hypothetical protein